MQLTTAAPSGRITPVSRLCRPQLVRPTALGIALTLGTVALIALQIAYPIARPAGREGLTVGIVAVFAFVCLLHVGATRGLRRAVAVLALTAVPGFLVEVLGVHTGFPFGDYRYSEVLGVRWFDVPLVVGLAWTMLAWPAALAARQLATGRLARVVLGGWAMTAGDLFLDPQMVSSGAWTWQRPGSHLPGMPDVPLTNFAGWLLATLLLSALVQTVMGPGADALGLGLYLWSWVAWATALAVFMNQPAAALWGTLAMGTVAVPLAVSCLRRLRATSRPPLIGVR